MQGNTLRPIVCVIGRKIFPTKSQRVCLGEIQNTLVVCSELCSLPTVASTQKVLLFLVKFSCMFASSLSGDVAFYVLRFLYNNLWCTEWKTVFFTFVKEKVNDRLFS